MKKKKCKFNLKNCKQFKKCCKKKWKIIVVVLGIIGLLFYFKGKFIVAWVNNKPIFRANYVKELETQAGSQILDTLITKSLIVQEAKKQKIKVTNEEVEKELKIVEELAEQQGLTLEELIEFQGITKNQLVEEIKLQKMIEKIVGKEVQISDDEVNEYIAENGEILPESLSSEELKETVSNQLKQQKLTEKVRGWISKLQQEAKVVSWL